ncbi:2-succinyl-6-hydroxy-2,4-cyclohexadiene-1-carboxylate synthase [compost metagenome]
MRDFTKELPAHTQKYIGSNDLFLEIFEGGEFPAAVEERPPLLFVHGAFTGSWMWSKYIPHFLREGWKCYVMNLRSHYRSRLLDMTRVTFEDYLEDIKAVIAECEAPPILIGFSMGGILGQKIAEITDIAGLVLIDSSISKEVHEKVPFQDAVDKITTDIIVPAPAREEVLSQDETADDIAFQRKYLTMESSKAFSAFSFHFGTEGISINSKLISCPCLVISAVNDADDDRRGKLTAEHLSADYTGLWGTTHTGLLVGMRYLEAVTRIMDWLKRFYSKR